MRTVALLVVAILLAGCATDQERRLDYLSEHPETSFQFAGAIREGEPENGMTEAEVRACCGDPDETYRDMRGRLVWRYGRRRAEPAPDICGSTWWKIVFDNGVMVGLWPEASPATEFDPNDG